MFSKLSMIVALSFLGHAAFAQPQESTRLYDVQQVKISKAAQFTTWIDDRDQSGIVSVTAWSDQKNSIVSCTLETSKISLDKFNAVTSERVNDGNRIYLSPKKPMVLKFKNSLTGIEAYKLPCNGEPELCDPNTYYGADDSLILSDEDSNEWNLHCFARKTVVNKEDVNFKGVQLK